MGLKSSKSDSVSTSTNAPANVNAEEKKYPDLSITVTDKYYNMGNKERYVSLDGAFDDQRVVADLLVALWDRATGYKK